MVCSCEQGIESSGSTEKAISFLAKASTACRQNSKGKGYILHCAYLKSLIPFFDRCFVITCMRFKEIHILFGKFIFAPEAAHCRSTKLPEKTVANGERSV